MEILEGNYAPKMSWAAKMRALEVKKTFFKAPLSKKKSLQVRASIFKKNHKMEFDIQEVEGELHVWRVK